MLLHSTTCNRPQHLQIRSYLDYYSPLTPSLPSPPAERLLLPPRFQLPEPQRVCGSCRELLLPIQPLLAGSIAPAVCQPIHDVTDWSAVRR